VGDIVDGWQLRRTWYWPQSHNDVVQKILRKARKGTHVVFVLPHGDHAEAYGLPKDPSVGMVLSLWRSGTARLLGVVTMFGVLVAGVLHYMRHGPLEVPDEAGPGDGPKGKEARP
jgi:hypothetical protein